MNNWIGQFDPVNINDCFDNTALHRVPKGIKAFDAQMTAGLRTIDHGAASVSGGGSAFRTTLLESVSGSMFSPKMLRKPMGPLANAAGRNRVMHMSVNGFDFGKDEGRNNLVTTNLDQRSSSNAGCGSDNRLGEGLAHTTSYDAGRPNLNNIREEQSFQMSPPMRTSVKLKNTKYLPKR